MSDNNLRILSYPSVDSDEYIDCMVNSREFTEVIDNERTLEQQQYSCRSYQNLVVRYFHPSTCYDRLLVFHGTGLGKSRTALWVIDKFKDKNKKALIIVKGDDAIVEFKKKIKSWFRATYPSEPEDGFLSYVDKYIEFTKYLKFSNFISGDSDRESIVQNMDYIREKYNNRIIVIDEIHNLRVSKSILKDYEQILTKAKLEKKRFRIIKEFLNIVQDSRVLLLSATPLFNSKEEIQALMQLIVPNANIDSCGSISRILRGRVSYYDEDNMQSPSGDKASSSCLYLNREISLQAGVTIPLVVLGMYGLQAQAYQASIHKNTMSIGCIKSSLGVIYTNNSFSISCIGDDTGTRKKPRANKKLYTTTIIDNVHVTRFDDQSIQQLMTGLVTERLPEISCKVNYLISQVRQAKGPVFAYCNLVDWTGIMYICTILDILGNRCVVNKTQLAMLKPTTTTFVYTFVTGDKNTCNNVAERISMFNDESNRDGKLIKLIIGSEVMSEAVDLMRVSDVHILTPHWNLERLHQIIGRVIRINSHKDLPPERRHVFIHLHAAVLTTTTNVSSDINFSVDFHMYSISERKAKELEPYVEELKRASIEHILGEGKLQRRGSYLLNYRLYYSSDYLVPILDYAAQLFHYYVEIDVHDFINGSGFNYVCCLAALDEIILRNLPIRLNGIKFHLRCSCNMLFLVDENNNELFSEILYDNSFSYNGSCDVDQVTDITYVTDGVNDKLEFCNNNIEEPVTLLSKMSQYLRMLILEDGIKRKLRNIMILFRAYWIFDETRNCYYHCFLSLCPTTGYSANKAKNSNMFRRNVRVSMDGKWCDYEPDDMTSLLYNNYENVMNQMIHGRTTYPLIYLTDMKLRIKAYDSGMTNMRDKCRGRYIENYQRIDEVTSAAISNLCTDPIDDFLRSEHIVYNDYTLSRLLVKLPLNIYETVKRVTAGDLETFSVRFPRRFCVIIDLLEKFKNGTKSEVVKTWKDYIYSGDMICLI